MTQPYPAEAVERLKIACYLYEMHGGGPVPRPCVSGDDLAALLSYVELMKWRPMDSAPIGTSFLAAIEVHSERQQTQWWERHIILIDEDTGAIGDDFYHGWNLGEYGFWLPLPPAPYSEG